MKINTLKLIILLFISQPNYSQILPDIDVAFKNFNGYSSVGNNRFGKKIKSGEAYSKIYLSSVENATFFSFQTSLIDAGEQVFKVSNVEKEKTENKLVYLVEAFNANDPNKNKKVVKFIFEYIDNKLIRFFFLVSDDSTIEFY